MLKPLRRVPPAGRRHSTTASQPSPAIIGKRQRSLSPPPPSPSLKSPEIHRPPFKRLRPGTEPPLLPLPLLPPTLPETIVAGINESVEAGAEPITSSAISTTGHSLAVASSPSPMVLSDSLIAPANRSPDHTLVESDRLARKRSRSLTPPDHQPSPPDKHQAPIIRRVIATPRPPAKRTRLEPPKPSSLHPTSPRKHFGSPFRHKKRDGSAPVSQEVLLARVMQSRSKDLTLCQAIELRTAESALPSDMHAEPGTLTSAPAIFATLGGAGESAHDTVVNVNARKSVTGVGDLAEHDSPEAFSEIEEMDTDSNGPVDPPAVQQLAEEPQASVHLTPTIPLQHVQSPEAPPIQIGSSAPAANLQLVKQSQGSVHPSPTIPLQPMQSRHAPSVQIGTSIPTTSTVLAVHAASSLAVPHLAEQPRASVRPLPTIPLQPVQSPQAPSIRAGSSVTATSTVIPVHVASSLAVQQLAKKSQGSVHPSPNISPQLVQSPQRLSIPAESSVTATPTACPMGAASSLTVRRLAEQPRASVCPSPIIPLEPVQPPQAPPIQAEPFIPETSIVFPARVASSLAVPQLAKQSQRSVHPSPTIPVEPVQSPQALSVRAGSSAPVTSTVFAVHMASSLAVPHLAEQPRVSVRPLPAIPLQPIQSPQATSIQAGSSVPATSTVFPVRSPEPTISREPIQSPQAPSIQANSMPATSIASPMGAASPPTVPQPVEQPQELVHSTPIDPQIQSNQVGSSGPPIMHPAPQTSSNQGPLWVSAAAQQSAQSHQAPFNEVVSLAPGPQLPSSQVFQPIQPPQAPPIIQPPYTSTIQVGSSTPAASLTMPVASSSTQPLQHIQSFWKSKRPFSSYEMRENRKTNLAKAMERLQRIPDALVVGIPLDVSSGTSRGSDGLGADHDILMVDVSDEAEDGQNLNQRKDKGNHVTEYPPQGRDALEMYDHSMNINPADHDVFMVDPSNEAEDERGPNQRKDKGKHVPKYPPQGGDAMYDHSANNINTADDDVFMADLSNEAEDERDSNQIKDKGKHVPKYPPQSRDAFETYEHLINNPDAPCTNAALATVLEVVVDLKSAIQTDLKTIMRTAMPPADGNDKRGCRGRKPAIPKTTFQVRHQDESNVNLQRDVHQLAKELLNLPEDPLRVPTPEELRLYAKKHPDATGPQINPFILDLASKGLSSPWNKRASSIFATEFLSRKSYLCTDRNAIEHAFRTYLMALQVKYKKQVGTTNEAARVAELDSIKRNARYAQRTYKRHRRCNALNSYQHIPGVDILIAELEQLPVDTMSGDETEFGDDEEPYLVKTKCQWRSKEADDLFEVCDALDLSARFDSNDRPDKGRFPDVRIASNRRDGRPVPPRLPQNLYSVDYKENLTAHEREDLQMRPTFKFIVPTPLLQIAERYRRSTSRNIPPLPQNHPRLALYIKPGTSLL